jgi:hypothetical protein
MTKPKFLGGLDFCDIELFNLALLAHQGWRLLQQPDTLNVRILKAVYYSQTDFLNAELGSHPSNIWRAVIDGIDALKQGLIRRIGTGFETHAWNDNWIAHDGSLRPYACLVDDPEPPQTVAGFIDQSTRQWNLEKLNTYFLPMDSEVIQSIPISLRVQPDFWAWHYERKGVFSVRSAYRMLACTKEKREAWLDEAATRSNHGATEASYTKLWQIRVPAKLRIILWRLAKQSLSTADVLHHRNIAPASVCDLWGGRFVAPFTT